MAVLIDHNGVSGIADAGVVSDSIDAALARAAEAGTDIDVVEMSLADARVWIEDALAQPTFVPKTDAWPLYRALVQWLAGRLQERVAELLDRIPVHGCGSVFTTFASDSASPFTDFDHRELLLELLEDDRDPLRWSAARVEQAMRSTPDHYYRLPLEVALDVPDLLRAFIPLAHVQTGIRDELTVAGTRSNRRAEDRLQAGGAEAGGMGSRRCSLAATK